MIVKEERIDERGTRRCAVYRIWRGAELLYIGASYNPWTRYGNHQSEKDWGKTATRMDIEWFNSRDEALRAERLAIAAEKPASNALDVTGHISRKSSDGSKPLADWLVKTGMTQTDLAAILGVSFSFVSRILSNHCRISRRVAEKVEAISGGEISASYLGYHIPVKHDPEFLNQVERMISEGCIGKDIAAATGVSLTTAHKAMRALRQQKAEQQAANSEVAA